MGGTRVLKGIFYKVYMRGSDGTPLLLYIWVWFWFRSFRLHT